MSLSKKFATVALALIASICLAVALFILPAKSSYADETVVEVSGEQYFTINTEGGKVLTGMSKEGEDLIDGKKFKIVLPDGVTAIGNNAFAGKSNLTSINLGDASALTVIGENAFKGCYSLEEITIPDNVVNIGTDAFYECWGLKTINYYADSAIVGTKGNPFAMSESAYAKSSVTVNIGSPSHAISRLPSGLFCDVEEKDGTVKSVRGHKGIVAVKFVNVNLTEGEGDKGWGTNLFRNCSSLVSVSFTNCNIPVINTSAFEGCTLLSKIEGLKSINLQTIKADAFKSCSNLFTITLGAGVSEIGEEAFDGCEKLVEVINLSTSLKDKIVKGEGTYGSVARYALVVNTTDADPQIETVNNYSYIKTEEGVVYLLGYSGTGTILKLPSDKYTGYTVYKKAFYGNENVTEIEISDATGVYSIQNAAFAECKSLERVSLPKNIAEIGANAFQGCVSLTTVEFNGNSLQTIQAYLFEGCSNLTSISLNGVKTIGYKAFKDCVSLMNVSFGTEEKLETIDGGAFINCASLELINLPSTVNIVEGEAFKGCSSLSTVYLPSDTSDTTVRYGAEAFSDCAENLLLISANMAQYDKDIAKNNLKNFSAYLTYKVPVVLHYDDGDPSNGGVRTVYRLFGQDAGYTDNNISGAKWTMSSSMPKQLGYLVSVWYDEGFNNKVGLEDLTAQLREKHDKIDLYAYYFKKPNLTARTGLEAAVYKEGMSYDMKQILENCFKLDGREITNAELNDAFRYNITSHYYVNGNKDSSWTWDPTLYKLTEAGKYVLYIDLKSDKYGQWESDIEIEFEIKPLEVEIVENMLLWEAKNGTLNTELKDLHFYGTIPYMEEQQDLGYRTKKLPVINSYTIYTGKQVEISLSVTPSKYGSVEETSYTGNVGTSAGTYTANAIITANNNYKFTFKQVPAPEWITRQGLSFVINDTTVEVTKQWYIAKSTANHLMNAGDNEEPNGMYTLIDVNKISERAKREDYLTNGNAWSYPRSETDLAYVKNLLPVAPTLSTKTNDSVAQLISFTLWLDNGNGFKQIGKEETISKFGEYFTTSLPAGKYQLIFYIKDTYDLNGNLIAGDSAGITYKFNVTPAVINAAEGESDINRVFRTSSNDFTVNMKSTGGVLFAPTKISETNKISLLDKQMQVDRKGIWADEAYDEYFEEFKIVYAVKSGDKDNYKNDPAPTTYYSEDKFGKEDYTGVVPRQIGTYTVYFKISAPNYVTLQGNDAITGVYELNIQLILDKPVINPIPFTGASVIGNVLMGLQDKIFDSYDIFTLHRDDKDKTPSGILSNKLDVDKKTGEYVFDSYIGLGKHYVFILIKESARKYVVWNDSISSDSFILATPNALTQQRRFLIVEFEIEASSKLETVPLSVNRWEYGKFTRDANAPNWSLQVYNNYNNYEFVLTSKANENDKYYFYGDPNKPLGDKLDFGKAPAGEYTLTAYAYEKGEVIVNSAIDVTIAKATPEFARMPYVDSWKYGDYSAGVTGVINSNYAFTAHDAELKAAVKLRYCTATEYNRENPTLYNSITPLLNDGQLPVGAYYLVLVLEESANFKAWSYGVRFNVLGAESFDWVYGDYSKNGGIDASQFGNPSTIIIEYKSATDTSGNWEDSVEKISGYIASEKELAVGSYLFRVRVNGVVDLSNYYSFKVVKASNSWTVAPTIAGWVEGSYSANTNKPNASAVFGNGSISYTITDENGKTYELKDANSLVAGKYTLTVTVAGSDNWEELSTSISFTVTGATGEEENLTGLSVALIIVSVVALALAATGTVILVLRNMKPHKAPRKTAKKEQRRK